MKKERRSVLLNSKELISLKKIAKKEKISLTKLMSDSVINLIPESERNHINKDMKETTIIDYSKILVTKEEIIEILGLNEKLVESYFSNFFFRTNRGDKYKLIDTMEAIIELRDYGVLRAIECLLKYFTEHWPNQFHKEIFISKQDVKKICETYGCSPVFTLDKIKGIVQYKIDDTSKNIIITRYYESQISNIKKAQTAFAITLGELIMASANWDNLINKKKETYVITHNELDYSVDFVRWGRYIEILKITHEFDEDMLLKLSKKEINEIRYLLK